MIRATTGTTFGRTSTTTGGVENRPARGFKGGGVDLARREPADITAAKRCETRRVAAPKRALLIFGQYRPF
ncbi:MULTISPECIES: hypothetical protein [unclassified Brevundimonas]|uniref:hypothetical protein n=1 Tax=unclassified Brevundimonas TaxID=2622653 RepID=UPI000B20A023|nr:MULTISPECIES: hypothetical protein [unclassified Brevundimonas]